ncbi:heterodimeric methylmalonyl-CoA mutase small subunit [Jatrophihabitans sp. GAS493]|uniref:methylmalonyl-CoA mutase family protein n=1 Tax=Jatrophihabitans sp. GAS493 TaxID=1907575 RepID=UPI000BB99D47|nr:methylmalonyl-CoA mutase family protein [Jatrophihabitans sp. GAS493]SOD72013.1 heterodimeric methylmalonyl-CoA mutase small subunit [Jatrophihabitans sp. GAS493]
MTAPSEHLDHHDHLDHLDLAADFPPASRDQWRDLVAGVLRKSGTPEAELDAALGGPEQVLASRTYDGISIAPLYTREDAPAVGTGLPGQSPFVRGATDDDNVLGWDVRQRHATHDPQRTNRAILTDLENGVTSVWLSIGDGAIAVADLPIVLNDVYLDLAPIALDAGPETEPAAQALLSLFAQRQVPAEDVLGTLGADPIGYAARSGTAADLDLVARVTALAAAYPQLRSATVDASVYHDSGASDSDEIAIAASVGVSYLRVLTAAGLSVDDALDRLEFRYAVTDDQFNSIAKLRAARRIWDRVGELSGATPSHRGQLQHAVTSAAMLTQRDPAVNMLRATIGCFAAAVGGARSITVAPYDAAIGLPDDLARRIARNTQSVLHDESSLGRVTDPAGGSWYVESLTDALAETAWQKFTALERDGGAANLAAVDALIAPTRAERALNIAHRRDPITGVSEFPALQEELLAREPAAPAPAGGLPVLRYAAEFEALRDRADAALAASGVRPKVFLAALGPVAAHSGRAGFAGNLFAAGGLESVVGTGEVDDLVAAFRDSGATVACLCSSDRLYADGAAPVASALKAAGATRLWLAGQPGERAESDAAAGVDGYLFAGCNALDVLTTSLELTLHEGAS